MGEVVLGIVIFVAIIVFIVKLIMNAPMNQPTWKGIIISALLGVLVFYLILCFFGFMGKEEDDDENRHLMA